MGRLARRLLYLPMLPIGKFGLPIPRKGEMTLVIGEGIKLPKMENPSAEDVQKYLDEFIAAIEALYKKHAKACGCDKPLKIC